MDQVTVTFDLIFNVRRVRGSLRHKRHTEFSFNSQGMSHHFVQVPGWPTLQIGDTVTATLRDTGNWQTLIGWVNHNSGEVAAPSPARSLRRAVAVALGVGALVAFVYALFTLDAGELPRQIRMLLIGLWAAYGVFLLLLVLGVLMRRMRWRRELRALENILIDLRRRGEVGLPVDGPGTPVAPTGGTH